MNIYFVYYLAAINLVTFIVYGVDKRKAIRQQWRISEKTLILLAVFGGSIGAAAGMICFHHKTKKMKFRISIPAIFLVQLVLMFKLYYN